MYVVTIIAWDILFPIYFFLSICNSTLLIHIMVIYYFSLLYVINIKVCVIMYLSILFFFIGIWDFTRFNGYVMISLTLLSLSLGTHIFLWVHTQEQNRSLITEVTGIWLKEVLPVL